MKETFLEPRSLPKAQTDENTKRMRNSCFDYMRSMFGRPFVFVRRFIWVVAVVFFFSLLVTGMVWDVSTRVSLSSSNLDATWQHFFGTDHMGRDLFYRYCQAMIGSIVPLWGVVIAATCSAIGFSALLFFGSERAIFRAFSRASNLLSALILSLPFAVLVLAFSVVYEKTGLIPVMGVGFFYIFFKTTSKLSQMLAESQNFSHWQGHEAMGGGRLQRFFSYGILSDFRMYLTSDFCFNLRLIVAAEITLSYLGFGVSEPDPSIGNIISSNIEMALKGDPRILFTALFVLAVTMMIPSKIEEALNRLRRKTSAKLS